MMKIHLSSYQVIWVIYYALEEVVEGRAFSPDDSLVPAHSCKIMSRRSIKWSGMVLIIAHHILMVCSDTMIIKIHEFCWILLSTFLIWFLERKNSCTLSLLINTMQRGQILNSYIQWVIKLIWHCWSPYPIPLIMYTKSSSVITYQ